MGLSTTYTKAETDFLLQKLQSELAGGLKAFGISGKQSKFFALFSTHPPLEDRIEKLLNQK